MKFMSTKGPRAGKLNRKGARRSVLQRYRGFLKLYEKRHLRGDKENAAWERRTGQQRLRLFPRFRVETSGSDIPIDRFALKKTIEKLSKKKKKKKKKPHNN